VHLHCEISSVGVLSASSVVVGSGHKTNLVEHLQIKHPDKVGIATKYAVYVFKNAKNSNTNHVIL